MNWIDRVVLAALAAGSSVVTPAWADDISIGGLVKYTVTTSGTESVFRQRLTGKIEAADPTSIINGMDQECFGTFVMAKDKNGADEIVGHGYCDAVDTAGDIWWLTFVAGAAGSDWTVVGGTGKYAGMTGSGKTFFTAESPVVVAAAAAPTNWRQEYEGKLNIPAR